MNEQTTAAKRLGDKARAQAENTFEKMSSAAEQTTNAVQETYAGAVLGAREFNLKVIEITRTNLNSAFDYAQQLLGVKSLPDFVDISKSHARKQLDALPEQTRELTEAAQKMAKETTEPFTSGFAKVANRAA
jgi:phasin